MALENLIDINNPIFILAILIIVMWSLVWKGLALWKAARKNSAVWFVILLVVNTLGILEILYLFLFSETGKKDSLKKEKRKRR